MGADVAAGITAVAAGIGALAGTYGAVASDQAGRRSLGQQKRAQGQALAMAKRSEEDTARSMREARGKAPDVAALLADQETMRKQSTTTRSNAAPYSSLLGQ